MEGLMQKIDLNCSKCGHRGLLAYCPACRGKAGGSVKSRKKTEAARRNMAKARKTRARF
jgi:hypothetical protein